MKRIYVYLSLTCLSTALFFFFNSKIDSVSKPFPKSAIFFIGDGMGLATITGTRIWNQGSWSSLNMESFSHSGFVKTYSGSSYVTDSAAAATALASGTKTYNGSIGLSASFLDPKKKSRPLQTILDIAKKNGKSVGIITTTRVSHATPAAFYAHVKKRDMEQQIVEQLINSDIDLLLGGGRCFFYPSGWNDPYQKLPGRRRDGRNIIQEMKQKGWVYLENKSDLDNVHPNAKVIGLFNYSHMTYETDRGQDQTNEVSLEGMLSYALKKFKANPKGYVLIVEGGRIDHASHENDAYRMVNETLVFDRVVGMTHKLVDLSETLLLLTADHETGGLSLNGYEDVKSTRGEHFISKKCDSTKKSLVSWASGPKHKDTKQDICLDTLAAHYGSSAAHTAVDVPILSTGTCAVSFTGFLDNEDIAWKLLKCLGLSFDSEVNYDNHGLFKKR